MQVFNLFTLTSDLPRGARFFLKSPFRSYYFLANTVLLLMSVGMGVYILEKYWGRLPQLMGGWIGVVIAGMIMLWAKTLREHRRIRHLYRSSGVREAEPGSLLDVTLQAAANMTFLGSCYTFFLVGALLIQLARMLGRCF